MSREPPRRKRVAKQPPQPDARAQPRRPEVFVGSAAEDVGVAKVVAAWLQTAGAQPRTWDEQFPAGWTTLGSLLKLCRAADGAVFVVSGVDVLKSRGRKFRTPRGNVVLELGMFLAARSPERTAIVIAAAEGEPSPELPGDLDGVTFVRYQYENDAVARVKLEEWVGREMLLADATRIPAELEVRAGRPYSWDDVERGVKHLRQQIDRSGFNPDVVLGLGRSGALVGGLLASFAGSMPMAFADLRYDSLRTPGPSYDVELLATRAALAIPLTGAQRVVVVEGATTTGRTPARAMEFLKAAFPATEFRMAVLIQGATSQYGCAYYAFVDRGALQTEGGRSLLPWHSSDSRTFLALPAGESHAVGRPSGPSGEAWLAKTRQERDSALAEGCRGEILSPAANAVAAGETRVSGRADRPPPGWQFDIGVLDAADTRLWFGWRDRFVLRGDGSWDGCVSLEGSSQTVVLLLLDPTGVGVRDLFHAAHVEGFPWQPLRLPHDSSSIRVVASVNVNGAKRP